MLKGFLSKILGKESKDSFKDHLYALILAGGGGTRLWPRSLNKSPKQFLPLFEKKTHALLPYPLPLTLVYTPQTWGGGMG